MADKRGTALSLQENEELAETVRTFPCLYDKSKKEYNDKNVAQNAWKVADQLDFIENSKFFILSEFKNFRPKVQHGVLINLFLKTEDIFTL